jgi:hypothetical protein
MLKVELGTYNERVQMCIDEFLAIYKSLFTDKILYEYKEVSDTIFFVVTDEVFKDNNNIGIFDIEEQLGTFRSYYDLDTNIVITKLPCQVTLNNLKTG